jgi:hypothetical protein
MDDRPRVAARTSFGNNRATGTSNHSNYRPHSSSIDFAKVGGDQFRFFLVLRLPVPSDRNALPDNFRIVAIALGSFVDIGLFGIVIFDDIFEPLNSFDVLL